MPQAVWMRICDSDGIEQSSVMVIDDYTFYLHSVEDGRPMLIDYEHELGSAEQNAHELVGLAKRLQAPDGAKHFAGNGAQLLTAASTA